MQLCRASKKLDRGICGTGNLVAALIFASAAAACSGQPKSNDGGQSFSGAMTLLALEDQTIVTGVAVWGEKPSSLRLVDILPSPGECAFVPTDDLLFAAVSEIEGARLDAGEEIVLASSSGTLVLGRTSEETPFLGPGMYLLPGAPFATEPRSVFTIVAEGGSDVSGFTGALVTPSVLTMISPAPDDTGVVIDLENGIPLMWATTGGYDLVHVTIADEDGNGETITCSFPDTGSALVPPSALEHLEAPEFALELSIGKTSFGAFTAAEAGLTLTQFSVVRSWNASVE